MGALKRLLQAPLCNSVATVGVATSATALKQLKNKMQRPATGGKNTPCNSATTPYRGGAAVAPPRARSATAIETSAKTACGRADVSLAYCRPQRTRCVATSRERMHRSRMPNSIAPVDNHSLDQPNRDKSPRVTPRVRQAIGYMIEEGLPYDDAARKAGLSVRAMRYALERQHVIEHLRRQRQVFRDRASAANIHRLVEIRDQNENRTSSVKAIQLLEAMGDRPSAAHAGRTVVPGVVIVIGNDTAPRTVDDTLIEINPNVVESGYDRE